jgi:hypothetical protein
MKRIISLLAVAALVAAMMVASALPAFAQGVDFFVKTPSVDVDAVPVESVGASHKTEKIEEGPVTVSPIEAGVATKPFETDPAHVPSEDLSDEELGL